MGKLRKWFDDNIGGSTEARFGFMGFLFAFILFVPPIVTYLWDKGGILMFSPTVCTNIVYALLILWLVAVALAMGFAAYWWRNRLQDKTSERLTKIEERLTSIEDVLATLNDTLAQLTIEIHELPNRLKQVVKEAIKEDREEQRKEEIRKAGEW